MQRFDNFHIAIFIKIQKEPLMQGKTTCISGFLFIRTLLKSPDNHRAIREYGLDGFLRR